MSDGNKKSPPSIFLPGQFNPWKDLPYEHPYPCKNVVLPTDAELEARYAREEAETERELKAIYGRFAYRDWQWAQRNTEAGRQDALDRANLPLWPQRTGVLAEWHEAAVAEEAAAAARPPPYELPPSRKALGGPLLPSSPTMPVRGKRAARQTGSEIGCCLSCRAAKKACDRNDPCARCQYYEQECVYPTPADPPVVQRDETLPAKRTRTRTQVPCHRCTQMHVRCDAEGNGEVACTRCRRAEVYCDFTVQGPPMIVTICTRCREKHLRCDRYRDSVGRRACAQCTSSGHAADCSFSVLTPRKQKGEVEAIALCEKNKAGKHRMRRRMKIAFPLGEEAAAAAGPSGE